MNRIRRHPILTIFIVLGLVVLGTVLFRLTSSGAKDAARKPRIITVGTTTPVVEDLEVRLTYTADIQPYQQVNLFSRVDGYIAKIYVDKGDVVKANQLLVEIDHTDYVHAVNRAKANLAAARANVQQQEASIRNAKLQLDRMKSLIHEQFVSQQDVDNAQANFDVALGQLESLRAQVRQMDVALAQAETNLAYSYIRAPFTGYVAERNLDPGAFVNGSTASTSTLSRGILNLHEIDVVRTLIEVVEKDVPMVSIGQKAEIRTDAYPGRVFEGQVTRLVQALNRNTRTMTVEVDLANPDHILKGGMFGRVELVVGRHPKAIQIAVDALTRLEDQQYVYVVKEGKARQVMVDVGVRSEERHLIEVTKGLTGTEQIIVSGKDLVSDGTPVQARPLSEQGVKDKPVDGNAAPQPAPATPSQTPAHSPAAPGPRGG
jgi:membrane fusion protein (multidrug efflux system)